MGTKLLTLFCAQSAVCFA